MSWIRDHLASPQYPDEEPLPDDAMRRPGVSLVKISGGWVQPGQPRWRAYLLFGMSVLGGLMLTLTPGPTGFDIISWAGVAFVVFGLFGLIETLVGKRLWRPAPRDPGD